MSDLIVIAFEDEPTGFELRAELVKMQKEYLLEMDDVVVATRSSEDDIRLHQAVNLTAAGAVGGGFWGALVGVLFLNPLLGAAVGAASGAIAGRFTDIGINDDFMREVSHAVVPGGSAVFVLLRKVTADKVLPRIEAFNKRGRVLQSSLSNADEDRLREAFAGGRLHETVAPQPGANTNTNTGTDTDAPPAAPTTDVPPVPDPGPIGR